MYRYQFVAHTADVSALLEADSREELFLAALLSMNEVLREDFCNEDQTPGIKKTVEVRSMDTTTLLIDFLSAVLMHSYLERALFCRLKVEALTDNHLKARIFGNPVDYFADDIKAVTYHGAEVTLDGNGKWTTPVVFDI